MIFVYIYIYHTYIPCISFGDLVSSFSLVIMAAKFHPLTVVTSLAALTPGVNWDGIKDQLHTACSC